MAYSNFNITLLINRFRLRDLLVDFFQFQRFYDWQKAYRIETGDYLIFSNDKSFVYCFMIKCLFNGLL